MNNPFQQCHFRSNFTLSSKYFSFFPRGTSLLSVFPLYLGFGVYYHPFNLHFQVNLLFFLINSNRNKFCHLQGFHFVLLRFQSQFNDQNHFSIYQFILVTLRMYNLAIRPEACPPSLYYIRFYQLGLCLVHSPLLETSLLFSIPSLIDMLKL